ncbi:MAG: hypothetical protein NW241_09845 [Bacteroidia bacterium]|nr:hypothetical protein [Bacteroidia bacterium]
MNIVLRRAGLCVRFVLMLTLTAACLPQARAQEQVSFDQAVQMFGAQRVLKFRPYSLELTDEGKEELRSISELFRISPVIMRNTVMVIQIFTCEEERKVKPYIGVCRGQVIIDYLESSVGMPRKKCLIRDGGASAFDPECVAGSGANVYLRPEWREK